MEPLVIHYVFSLKIRGSLVIHYGFGNSGGICSTGPVEAIQTVPVSESCTVELYCRNGTSSVQFLYE